MIWTRSRQNADVTHKPLIYLADAIAGLPILMTCCARVRAISRVTTLPYHALLIQRYCEAAD